MVSDDFLCATVASVLMVQVSEVAPAGMVRVFTWLVPFHQW